MAPAHSLAALAYAEAPTLSTALALIAQRRLDVDAALRAAALVPMPVDTAGAAAARALRAVAADHALNRIA